MKRMNQELYDQLLANCKLVASNEADAEVEAHSRYSAVMTARQQVKQARNKNLVLLGVSIALAAAACAALVLRQSA